LILKEIKGIFCIFLIQQKNQNYNGKYPALEYYGYNEMKNSDKRSLEDWYNTVKDKTFNFRNEIFYYCLLDVLILAKGCNIFRNIHSLAKES
jgi:hypothetical protein